MSNREFDRLRWRCRRGLLELDLILHSFLDNHYAQLTDTQRRSFVRLLETPDNTLLAYIQGTENPPDIELNDIVRKIQ